MPNFSCHLFRQRVNEHRYRDAAWYARKAAASAPSDECHLWNIREAGAWLLDNRGDDALTAAEKACALTPEDSDGFLVKSDALYLLDKIDDALADCEQAERLGAESSAIRQRKTDCFIRLGRFEDAYATHLHTAHAMPQKLFYLIRILKSLNRFDEAFTCTERLMAEQSLQKTARWLRCDLEIAHDGFEVTQSRYNDPSITPHDRTLRELRTYLDRLSLHPPAPKRKRDYLAMLMKHAFTLAKTGREHQALPKFEEVLLSLPADRYCNNSYPAAARRAGRLGAALDFYRLLSALFPEERRLDGVIRKISNEITMVYSQQ